MRKIVSSLFAGHITLCSTFSFTVRILKPVWLYIYICLYRFDVCNKQKEILIKFIHILSSCLSLCLTHNVSLSLRYVLDLQM